MLETQHFGEHKTGMPHLLIVGGVHGDEPPGVEALTNLAVRLKTIQVRGQITVIPVVNQPAWELRSRCGPDGLDLARTCPGRDDGSITERIAAELSRQITGSTALIDLHSGGSTMEIFPLTGYMMVRDDAVLQQQRQMATAFGLPIVWGTSDQLDGRTLSIARDHRIPAIYAEYGSAQTNQTITAAYVQGCLAVATALGLIDRGDDDRNMEKPLLVEQTSPGSGHLQICHPSPCDGDFEGCLELGDDVAAGEALGNVVAADTRERINVAAEKTGKLIVRRAQRSVRRGDSLGVILEVS